MLQYVVIVVIVIIRIMSRDQSSTAKVNKDFDTRTLKIWHETIDKPTFGS